MFNFFYSFIQQHCTPDAYPIISSLATIVMVYIGLGALFVFFAKTHASGVAEGLGLHDEVYNEGFEQGILHGKLNILVTEDAQFGSS
jgi:hypothetical protein